jgi:hypothetical protein
MSAEAPLLRSFEACQEELIKKKKNKKKKKKKKKKTLSLCLSVCLCSRSTNLEIPVGHDQGLNLKAQGLLDGADARSLFDSLQLRHQPRRKRASRSPVLMNLVLVHLFACIFKKKNSYFFFFFFFFFLLSFCLVLSCLGLWRLTGGLGGRIGGGGRRGFGALFLGSGLLGAAFALAKLRPA